MKRILILPFIVSLFLTTAYAQKEPQRFTYHVWGRVFDEFSRPVAKINVCFIPSIRPINGRIPCVKTDSQGKFSVSEKTIPDKYHICASTSEFLFQQDSNSRSVCSKSMEFGRKDESKKMILKLKP